MEVVYYHLHKMTRGLAQPVQPSFRSVTGTLAWALMEGSLVAARLSRGIVVMERRSPRPAGEVHNLSPIALIVIVPMTMVRPVRRPVLRHQAGSADTTLVLTLHRRA